MTNTLTLVPALTGPLLNTAASHQFNSTLTYDEPLDLSAFGFVEQEFFVTGTAAVYDDGLSVLREVPYTNRLIVRRPDTAQPSGVVFVEILNPSNGYDAEGMWRRAWDYFLAHGHTYVAFSAKPVTIDSLKIFDPQRYLPLSWDLEPTNAHVPVDADFNAYGVVDGCEEGIVWDIITQVGNLLADPSGSHILGGLEPSATVLMGQSQSGHTLNTWLRHFHPLAPGLWDGFIVSVASGLERPLRQEPVNTKGFYAVQPMVEAPPVSVPTMMITAEGDVRLVSNGFGLLTVATRGLGDGELRRHWHVSGASHTELSSPVMPGNPEIVRAGRKPRAMTSETLATGSIFPTQVAVTAALDAVVTWAISGQPAAQSVWFELDDEGQVARDSDGNSLGGLRYGLIVCPVATFDGSPTGGTLGTIECFDAGRVLGEWPTLASYLDSVAAVDRDLQARGYLNDLGFTQLQEVARQLWTRATGRAQ